MFSEWKQRGFTLTELLIALVLAAVLLAGVSGLLKRATSTDAHVVERNQLLRDGRFAMNRMVSATSRTRRLLLPLSDNPGTNWPENVREQTVPASPPIGDSTLATAVLAVTLPDNIDLDADGYPDADDDRDGSIDEDLPNDSNHDFRPGIALIDDDGDGWVDEIGLWLDDDEDGSLDDDPIDGVDNDGDGSTDEDPPANMHGDSCPGLCGVDDNLDGTIDNGSNDDDDEDGGGFEDPYDPVVFYLNDSSLMERMPVPWNEDGISWPDGPVDGRDFVESVIAENVTQFRVERPPASSDRQLINLTLELTSPSGQTVSLDAQVRVGSIL